MAKYSTNMKKSTPLRSANGSTPGQNPRPGTEVNTRKNKMLDRLFQVKRPNLLTMQDMHLRWDSNVNPLEFE